MGMYFERFSKEKREKECVCVRAREKETRLVTRGTPIYSKTEPFINRGSA